MVFINVVLPGAVPAENGHRPSATRFEVDVEQHLARAVVGRELVDGEDGRGRRGGFRHGSDRLPGPCGSAGSRRSSRCRARCPGRAPSSTSETSRMKSRSCSTIRMEQWLLIGARSSPVTRRSSRLIPRGRLVQQQRASGSRRSAMAISSHCCSPWDRTPARSSARSEQRDVVERRHAPRSCSARRVPSGSAIPRESTGPAGRAGCCRTRTARAARW